MATPHNAVYIKVKKNTDSSNTPNLMVLPPPVNSHGGIIRQAGKISCSMHKHRNDTLPKRINP
jgi:hypothetical protein